MFPTETRCPVTHAHVPHTPLTCLPLVAVMAVFCTGRRSQNREVAAFYRAPPHSTALSTSCRNTVSHSFEMASH